MVIVHTPVGFDERGPLHCFLESKQRGMEVRGLVAYVPKNQPEKGRAALQNLKYIVERMVDLFEVTEVPSDPQKLALTSLLMSRKLIESIEKYRGVVICLSCGMRMLDIALYTAALTLKLEEQEKIKLFFEIEGDPTSATLIPLTSLSSFISHLYGKEPLKREIMLILSSGEQRLQDIYSSLKEEGYEYSKTWIRKLLKDMVKEGLIEEEDGYYSIKGLLRPSEPS